MKYPNIVFFPASDELRKDLYNLGLYPTLVRIEDTLQFMVETNQLRLIKELSRKHDIPEFHTSDSKRQVHKVIFSYHGDYDYFPVKLGHLKRLAQKPENGKSFLVVTEDNSTYYYIVE